MRRYAFNLLSAISLLLFLASVYFLARSWIVRDKVNLEQHITDMHRQIVVDQQKHHPTDNCGAADLSRAIADGQARG